MKKRAREDTTTAARMTPKVTHISGLEDGASVLFLAMAYRRVLIRLRRDVEAISGFTCQIRRVTRRSQNLGMETWRVKLIGTIPSRGLFIHMYIESADGGNLCWVG